MNGLIKEAKASKKGPQISHLLFANDSILFRETSSDGEHALKTIIREYELCLGQCINFNKLTIFFRTNTIEIVCQHVSKILEVRCSNDPEKYLGLPNVVRCQKKE